MKPVLSYLLSIGGAGLVVYAVALAAAVNCNYAATRFRFLHLLRTTPWQAEMIARTKPGSFFDGIAAAMKGAAIMATRDPAEVALASRPAYDAAVIGVGLKWKAILGKLKPAGAALVGGLALALSTHTLPIVHILLLVAAIGAAIWLFVTRTDCERYVVLARLEILPDVDLAIAQGRHGKAPG